MSKRGINGGWSHEEKLSESFSTEYFKTKQNEKQTKEEKGLSQVFVGSFFLPNNESGFTILGYSLDKKFVFFKIRPTPLKSCTLEYLPYLLGIGDCLL